MDLKFEFSGTPYELYIQLTEFFRDNGITYATFQLESYEPGPERDLKPLSITRLMPDLGNTPVIDRETEQNINKFDLKYFKCEGGCGNTMPNPGTCMECSRDRRPIRESLLSDELKQIVDCKWCRDGRDLAFGQSCPDCGKIGKYKFID